MVAPPTSTVAVPQWDVVFIVRALEPDELRLVVALTEAGRPAEAAATVWKLGVVSPRYSFAEALAVASQGTDETQAVLDEIARLTDAYAPRVAFERGFSAGLALGRKVVGEQQAKRRKTRRRSRSR